ncbi:MULTISPECIES: hypothetical protein [Polaromonas]|uniref:Uncharacterized protein n=1 Tax=Polaromonas aquatica TaxID=332657 RepID=A0ABW1TY23_9BURK
MNIQQMLAIPTDSYRIIEARVGSKSSIPNWPAQNIDGLIQALMHWTLSPASNMHEDDPAHPHNSFSKPFRSLCWGSTRTERIEGTNLRRYIGTEPIHPDHPEAIRFYGNFMLYSFGFWLDTDDQALIDLLDALIEQNMQRPEYLAAKS